MDKLANRKVDRVSRWCCRWSKINKFIILKLSSHLDHGCSQHITVYAAMHAAVKCCSSEQCLKTCRRQCSAQWQSMCQRARWGALVLSPFSFMISSSRTAVAGSGQFPNRSLVFTVNAENAASWFRRERGTISGTLCPSGSRWGSWWRRWRPDKQDSLFKSFNFRL